jgi:RNA polymerase sigma factor (sigma-70 family)
MNAALPTAPPSAGSELLIQIRNYLTRREHGLPPSKIQEAAWRAFYDIYARKIRAFAITCGTAVEELVDCVQEVWRELLVRLPTFQLDSCRGQFDSWLFRIVQGKAADLHRSRKRRPLQAHSDALQTATDHRPSPGRTFEEEEMVTWALEQVRKRLSECTFQVLHLRLVEQRPVAEVAKMLGLSHQQVWYRYHRARRELEDIGSALARPTLASSGRRPTPREKAKDQ